MKRTILKGLLFGLAAGMVAYLLFSGMGNAGAEPTAEWIYEETATEWVHEDSEENRKIEEALDWHYLDDVTLTAYCPCETCCGVWALDRPGGIVYTASGAEAQAGQTIAVDPDVIPLGAWVEIDGNLYHAEDTGDFSGAVVDLYFDSHEDALQFGRQVKGIRWYA